ncbi:MAG: hypothetical protein ACREKN_09880 [Longimicrobiaceae bacterium]
MPGKIETDALELCRRQEKRQALFYRGLAARAEEAGDTGLAERLHGLHADEQHHLSRLTARVIELDDEPDDLSSILPPAVTLDGWEAEARQRERDEVRLYQSVLGELLEAASAALLRECLEVDRRHEEHLGGKWTEASRG